MEISANLPLEEGTRINCSWFADTHGDESERRNKREIYRKKYYLSEY